VECVKGLQHSVAPTNLQIARRDLGDPRWAIEPETFIPTYFFAILAKPLRPGFAPAVYPIC